MVIEFKVIRQVLNVFRQILNPETKKREARCNVYAICLHFCPSSVTYTPGFACVRITPSGSSPARANQNTQPKHRKKTIAPPPP